MAQVSQTVVARTRFVVAVVAVFAVVGVNEIASKKLTFIYCVLFARSFYCVQWAAMDA